MNTTELARAAGVHPLAYSEEYLPGLERLEQPEALRLAEQLEAIGLRGPVAAELRRLHAEVERLSLDSTHSCHAECQRPLCRLTRERGALLEFAKYVEAIDPNNPAPLFEKARAAIKAVEGENT